MSQPKSTWSRITGMSVIVLVASVGVSVFWHAGALDLLLGLFVFGALAGWLARRHGWLAGVIVGLPLAVLHLTRAAALDYGSLSAALSAPDYWQIAAPTIVACSGMAIIGGISGAWMQDAHFQKRSKASDLKKGQGN
jgi:hypothetical protein